MMGWLRSLRRLSRRSSGDEPLDEEEPTEERDEMEFDREGRDRLRWAVSSCPEPPREVLREGAGGPFEASGAKAPRRSLVDRNRLISNTFVDTWRGISSLLAG